MFKLFGKKPEPQWEPGADSLSRHPKASALSAEFKAEEFDILAVTGANGFGGGEEDEGEEYRTVTLPLTAWREDDGPIHQEDTCLVALADDKLLAYLRRRAPQDSIIQVRVRQGLWDDRFLMVGMPGPVMDPELKAILDEQKKPVTFWESGLGTFALNRSVGWFETEADWLGQPVRLEFDQDENRADCLLSFHTLMDQQAEWDQRVRALAADKLLSLANDWEADTAGNEEREAEEITREDFMSRMELDAVQVYEDGSFDFWFNDGDLFWGHFIHVTGSLQSGPEDAQMEG